MQVDTFTGSIGGNEDAHLRVLLEQFLHLAALVPHHTTVDGHHSVVVPEQGADLIGQIAQSIPVLCKDDEFFPLPIGGKHFAVVLQQLG